MSRLQCRVCGAEAGTRHSVREMMFGTREVFSYFECADCGCCQLTDDVDLAAHYPPHYQAYQVHVRPTGLRRRLRMLRNAGVFRGNILGRLLNIVAPYPVYGASRWFAHLDLSATSRILDVGCGGGELLRDLLEAGFAGAEGMDPFLPEHAQRTLGRRVRKCWLHEVSGQYDVVMLHHVLEHMPDQVAALEEAFRITRPGGLCLVRIPVISGDAWTRYGVNWVQLDAPRHLFLHTEASLGRVASNAGFVVDRVEYDSTEFQFAGSELYVRDIPLADLAGSYSAADMRRFRRLSRHLNAERRGDQAAFYLRREGEAATR